MSARPFPDLLFVSRRKMNDCGLSYNYPLREMAMSRLPRDEIRVCARYVLPDTSYCFYLAIGLGKGNAKIYSMVLLRWLHRLRLVSNRAVRHVKIWKDSSLLTGAEYGIVRALRVLHQLFGFDERDAREGKRFGTAIFGRHYEAVRLYKKILRVTSYRCYRRWLHYAGATCTLSAAT